MPKEELLVVMITERNKKCVQKLVLYERGTKRNLIIFLLLLVIFLEVDRSIFISRYFCASSHVRMKEDSSTFPTNISQYKPTRGFQI